MQQQAITQYLQENMPQDSKENTCTANTLDPERLLAWGNSQLKEIEKKRKKKKPNSEEKQKSKSFDGDCDSKLEMKENKDVINKKKKRKKSECDVVSVNIDLKKGDISYETNFSKSNKKKSKKRKSDCSDVEVKNKKKDCILESNNNISNKGSYVMSIKLTKVDDLIAAKENDVKSKKKKKKKKHIHSSDDESQERTVKMRENELSPSRKKKKHKKESSTSKKENNSEISDPSESASKNKTKKKKMRDSFCTEHMETNAFSYISKTEDGVNKEIAVYTKKEKSKKRIVSSETGDADFPPVRKKKKKKHKEKTDNLELDTFPESVGENVNEGVISKKKKKKNENEGGTVGMGEIDLDTSSCAEYHKEKKKKNTDSVEEISDEICLKKKQKKKKEKNTESLDGASVFSVSSSTSKSGRTGKVGAKFGKSPISLLLSNQESCSSCACANTCSRKVCKNNSGNSTDTETDSSTSSEEVSNTQIKTIQTSVVIKQEKIDTEVQNFWPANIRIKQEKIDDPPLDNPRDVCGEMATLNPNIRIKQEVCETPTGCISNNGENTENVSKTDLINSASKTENGDRDINNPLVSSNNGNTEVNGNVNNENQDKQKHLESNQYYLDSCETYYNFCDNKLVINEEIGVYNEVQNQNDGLSDVNVGKLNLVMNNNEVLQKETSCEANGSLPNENVDTTNTVVDNEEVSKEKICHNYGFIKLENDNVSHNPTSTSEDIIENSVALDYIPLADMETHNEAYTSPGTRIVNQEHNNLHITVHQNLNKRESDQDGQRLSTDEGHRLQSNQNYQSPVENECRNQQTKRMYKNNKKILLQRFKGSRYFENHQSPSLRKSLLFTCVRPQFRLKEQVSRLLKVDVTQIEFCYYRMSSKFYQDVHVRFSNEKQFEKVIRYYANRVHCKSWHIRNSSKIKEDEQKNRKSN